MMPRLPRCTDQICRRLSIVALALLAALAATRRAQAQNWNESGDAGQLPATAQVTTGTGALTSINGRLGTASDVDMYCIRIPNPAGALIRLQCVVITGPDLWVFDATGKGVGANSWCVVGDKRVTSALITTAGTYYVAVSFDGVYPVSGANAIWNPANVPERAPDGPGAAGTVTGWTGTGNVQPLNPYQILLSAANYCDAAVSVLPAQWGRLKLLYR